MKMNEAISRNFKVQLQKFPWKSNCKLSSFVSSLQVSFKCFVNKFITNPLASEPPSAASAFHFNFLYIPINSVWARNNSSFVHQVPSTISHLAIAQTSSCCEHISHWSGLSFNTCESYWWGKFPKGKEVSLPSPLNSLSKALFSAGQFVSYTKCTRVVKPSSLVKFISSAVTFCLLSLRKCPRKFPTIVCLTFPPRPLKNTFKRRRCHFARWPFEKNIRALQRREDLDVKEKSSEFMAVIKKALIVLSLQVEDVYSSPNSSFTFFVYFSLARSR
jgi:hypothetical protein